MTIGEVLMVPLSILLLLITAGGGLFRQIDKRLNYSLKKKVKFGPFKYLYLENRKDECLHGPVLEEPNCGVYLPVAILLIIVFVMFLISLIWSLILIFTEYTDMDVQMMAIITSGPAFIALFVGGILYCIYNKYVKNQSRYIQKIYRILEERTK